VKRWWARDIHAQVAERIAEYEALSIDTFIPFNVSFVSNGLQEAALSRIGRTLAPALCG
jgi:hypothetical protein